MSHSIIFRSGKLSQKVEFTNEEIERCPFIKKSIERATDICPNNHHVLPITIRVTSLSVKTIGNFLCFMKNIPLPNLLQQDVCDLAVMACAFEMEELAAQLLKWKPLEPPDETVHLTRKPKKAQGNNNKQTAIQTEQSEQELIASANILLQRLGDLHLQ